MWLPLPANSKAAEVWLAFIDDDHTKYFFLEGAVRSSKTFGSIIAWADYVQNVAPPGPLIMMGNTYTTLKQNVLYPLIELVGSQNAKLKSATTELELFGRIVYLFGAPNIQAMFKLQGKGAVAAYCDEANTYPYDVWQMLGTRTAAEGIKIISTFNPGSPLSWMKLEYLDRLKEVNGRSWHFTLDDNPFLSEKVKNELKSQYTGMWRQRYVEGLWVMAEGAIYSFFDSDPKGGYVVSEVPKDFDRYHVGIDYAESSVNVMLLLGRSQGVWYVLRELYWDAKKQGHQKTNTEYSKDFGGLIEGKRVRTDCDPGGGGTGLINQLRRDYQGRGYIINQAMNPVVPGIQAVTGLMTSGRLKIHFSCKNTIQELSNYVWDSNAQERGEDKPLKVNDHCCDALRYAVMRIVGGTATVGAKPAGF